MALIVLAFGPQPFGNPLPDIDRPRVVSEVEGLARCLVVVARGIERPRPQRDRQGYSRGSGWPTGRARRCRRLA